MTTKEVIEIGKKVILIAGTNKKVSKKQSEEIIKKLEEYKVQLEESTSKYSPRILWFIHDILGDIQAGRELQIDSIKNDTYIENLLVTKNERDVYNSLIEKDIYKEIIKTLKSTKTTKKELDTYILKIEKNFNSYLKKISTKNVSKNFLIFTSFQIEKPQQAIKNILNTLAYRNINIYNSRLVKMYKQILILKKEIRKQGITFYNKSTFEYKYMDFNTSNNFISNDIVDTSFSRYKSGNPKEEYKKLLLQL